MMQYIEPVFRPPSEAKSLILQVSNGCSYNKCTFCEMYVSSQKKFKPKAIAEIEKEVKAVAAQIPGMTRFFLADGDAMTLSFRRLKEILECINKHFPNRERVTAYCLPRNIKKKTVEELVELKELGLTLWHTIFLIGSRGSLLGLGACTLFLAHIVKSKKFKITIALALVGALITQGGIIMSRSQETEASSDEPINPRIASWGVGMDLAWEYPLTGVGVRKFVTASDALYPGRSPHVAHNTLIGLSAESGLPAGAAFILLLLTARRSYRYTQRNEQIISSNMLYINNASGASILGFAVCSIFLDLTIFEPFYFMIIIIQAKDFIVRQQIKDQLQATI